VKNSKAVLLQWFSGVLQYSISPVLGGFGADFLQIDSSVSL